MSKVATLETNKFGVVIIFPKSPNRDTYKELIRNGFTKTGAMGWHHWISEDQSEEKIAKAGEIVEDFNSAKPERKYKLYPFKKAII